MQLSIRWNYDGYGRVTNKLDQAGVEILRYTYDPNSRLTNRWSKAKGNTIYSYDPVGNLTNINYPTSTDVRFAYDPLNRVTNMVDAAGTTKYAYTAGGQLWTEDGPWSNDTVTNSYTYRMRTGLALQQSAGVWTNGFWYDYAKRLTNVTSPAGTFSYLFSGVTHHASRITLPNTSYITNHYDNVARLLFTKLNNSSHTTLNKHEYVLNAGNQRTKHTRQDNSHLTFSYDNIGQLTIVRATNSGGTLLSGETKGYAYDAAWNLNRRTNNSSGSTHTFNVDGKNQLTSGAQMSNVTHDDNGNLTFGKTSSHTSEEYRYDDENRLVTWYFYDDKNGGDGSPTSSVDLKADLVCDGLGRLRKRVEYDTDGWSWNVVSETRYMYDGMRVIQERNSGNTPTVSYTRGSDLSGTLEGAGGIGGLLGRSHGYSSGNWTNHNFYHADGGGNVTYLVNSSQTLAASYKYDPYGRVTSQSGAAMEYYYYGYRWYAPNVQRWLNRDPIGERYDANLYRFVYNSPLNYVDPDGLTGWALYPPQGWSDPSIPAMIQSPEYQQGFQEGMAQGALMGLAIASLFTPIPGDEAGLASMLAGRFGKWFCKGSNPQKIIQTRKAPGRDGATSRIIKEEQDGQTISVTHQVVKDGKVIHQHQTHIGKHGTERRFPDEWVENPTIPKE